MKIIMRILLLCLLTVPAFAADLEIDLFMEEIKLGSKYSYNVDNLDYRRDLLECMNKGNYYCAQKLGQIYYDKQEYTYAHKYFLKCTDRCVGNCDFHLGFMYASGLGGLQNDDKSYQHSKKAAKAGVAEAAYNLSVDYLDKMWNVYPRYTEDGQKQFSYYAIRNYAWLKVAMAMGLKTYNSDDATDLPVENLLKQKKSHLASYGLLSRADNLASEICSGIKACKQ